MLEKLSEQDVTEKLGELASWSGVNDSIQRTFQFRDFVEAMKFVNKVAEHAEAVQHHPDVLVRYNKVTLTLSTHDAGGITEKDFAFAGKADSLV